MLKLSTDVGTPICADKFCSFGIIEGIGIAIAAGAVSAGATAATAAVIGTIGSYALVGAGVGALTAAVTGGKVLKGAGYGALIGATLGTGASIGGITYEGGLGALAGAGAAGAAEGEAAVAGAEGAAGAGAGAAGAEGAAGAGAGAAGEAAAPSLAATSGEAAGALSSAPIVSTGEGALATAAPEVGGLAPTVAAVAPTLAEAGTPAILSGAETVAAAPAGIAGAAPSASGLAAYGGGESGLLSTLGLTKGDLIKGALSSFGSAMSGGDRPPPEVPRGPYFNMPLQSSGYLDRRVNQQYQPAGGDWYTYGQRPNQPSFYTNNNINLGYARGGALSAGRRRAAPPQPNPVRYVSGGGDGVSDDVPAQLSDGEYVLTAADVSRIGNGSTQAGVKKLDRMRQQVARDAGARKIQGRVKEPASYLRQAAMGR